MKQPKAGSPKKMPARAPLSRATTAQAAQSTPRFMSAREKKRAAKGSESLIGGASKRK